MIMATGLAVDYSVYFAQKFMVTSGASRTERDQKAMSHTGYAVFLGGFTALIGTIPLAFASSKVWSRDTSRSFQNPSPVHVVFCHVVCTSRGMPEGSIDHTLSACSPTP